jgi:hypothetical protein
MTPREAAQQEAERTFDLFILWSKRAGIYSALFLMVVVFGCKSGSQYNGEVYSPMNLN